MNTRFNSRGSNWALIVDGAVVARFHTKADAMAEQARRYRLFNVWGMVQPLV